MSNKINSQNLHPTDLFYSSIIIPLLSSEGEKLFLTSYHKPYDLLNSYFQSQEHLSFCGIACISTLLNYFFPFKKWNQSDIYSIIAKNYMLNGITLLNLSHIINIYGLSSIIRYCNDQIIEEQFRKDLKKENCFIIVNYWRQFEKKESKSIHQGGHFSLIGGYNSKTDYILILDPNSERFPHHWLSLKDLLKMMCTYDRMSSMPRGYLIVTNKNDEN